MDIMNNMKVSSSKFTFSLIAITALLVLGTGMGMQQTFAAAPTFVAIHNSTTTTEIIFSEGVKRITNRLSDCILEIESRYLREIEDYY